MYSATGKEGVQSWGCPQCTLVNSVIEVRCKACNYDFPSRNGVNGLLHRIKLPHISINSALEKLDSALDLVANSFTPRNAQQNSQFYPQQFAPSHSASIDIINNQNWTCSGCSGLNTQHGRRCIWCTLERESDITSTFWTCSNPRCLLRQPVAPPNSRCPLCRSKSNWQRMHSSRSMPQINKMVQNEVVQVPSVQIDGNETLKNSALFKDIVAICRQNHERFVDDSFPHTLHSIGPLSMLEKKNLNIIWLRPEGIVTRDGRMTRWAVFNDPSPIDIEQGFLGNCWFLSALAVVAERPDILERLFITKEYSHQGIYELRLCIDGIWENVIVDDCFPCHKRSKAMLFAVGRKNQLWVSLLEKALAKVNGNYAILRAGRTIEGLSTLTGAPTQSIDLEQTGLDEQSRASALDLVWAQLLSARDARFIMGCSCGAGKRHVDEKAYRAKGLMTQHAYSVLDVRQTHQGFRVVQLRNPWGTFVWLGEFSQKWPGWTPQLSHELHSEANSQPGTFWMPFEQFAHYFDTVDVAQIHPSWTSARFSLGIGWEEGSTRVVRLTVTEPTELCVTLHQRNARTALDQIDIMALIHKEDPSREAFPGELICRSPRRIQPVVRTEDKFFQPGEYLVCAHSFAKFGDKMMPGALVVHSSKKIYLELVSVPLNVLQASIISLMLKEGNLQEVHGGFVARYLTEEFAGLALMMDNTGKDSCTQVCSDCQDSSNVLSTRGSLLAVDSIPPLHRQIVTVLTHFEPSQAYIVGHRLSQRSTTFPQLRDFAPTEFSSSQNFPLMIGPAVGALHAPSPLYS